MKRFILGLATAMALLSAAGSAWCQEKTFAAVIAVVSNYSVPLESFEFLGVADRIESALKKLAMRRGYTTVDIKKLDGANGSTNEPTDRNIKLALTERTNRRRAEDAVVFFYLGHGATEREEFVLLASGARSTMDKANYLQYQFVADVVSTSKAGFRAVFIDACQVVVGANSGSSPVLTEKSEQAIERHAKDNPGFAVFLASDQRQPAWVSRKGRKGSLSDQYDIGFFTGKVIEALEFPERLTGTGPGGAVLVDDLQAYLVKAVPEALSKAYELEKQEPKLKNFPDKARTYLFESQPLSTERLVDVLVVNRHLAQGTRLQAGDLTSNRFSSSIVGAHPLPNDFDAQIRGACLVKPAMAGEVLKWENLGVGDVCNAR